ncbi:BTB/POZ domain-containing protein 3 [Nilaparvata lugens]|uniref:BTB/POZ domain-containing protein 3 n=1 Tax=Nilaparvata lugens TaxID=108931 RepID=UPI00193D0E2C|nr:BTB/POZ domain-containing protein 3 [Nilaparvata lugens]
MSANGNNDPNPEKTFFEKRFQRLAESDTNSDCHFVVGPQRTIIKGHKVILSAASEVFQAMFFGLLKENKQVKVEDLSAEGFEGMKTFIYTGEIAFISALHALSTYIAARKYLVPQLSNVCTEFIEQKLDASEVLEFCDICKIYKISEFKDLCMKIIQEKTDEVVDSDHFIYAEPETIEMILESPALKLNSEIEVFDNFERWALAEVERRAIGDCDVASSFNNLKKHIRFFTMKGEEFVTRVAESRLLSHEEKHAIAFNQIKLSSKPVPESISLIEQPREFNRSQSDYLKSTHRFVVPIDKVDSSSESCNLTNIINCYYPLSGVWEYKHGFIYFRLSTYHYCLKAMFNIKFKFRILAQNTSDDLVFENEINDFVYSADSTVQKCIYPVVIPISKLQNGRFMKSGNNQVVIEGTFIVKKINL